MSDKKKPASDDAAASHDPSLHHPGLEFFKSITDMATNMAGDTLNIAENTAQEFGFITDPDPLNPERLEVLKETGLYLRDMRELAGYTQEELAELLQLDSTSILEAAEKGTAKLPSQLTLKLSSILSRHDPSPFILRLSKVYNPTLWRTFEAMGLSQIPMAYAREREFVNLFRGYDTVRDLNDEEFLILLKYVKSSFEFALEFIEQQKPSDDAEPQKNSSAD